MSRDTFLTVGFVTGVIMLFCLTVQQQNVTQNSSDASSIQKLQNNISDTKSNIDWIGLFSFVPYHVTACTELFKERKGKLTEDIKPEYDRLNEKLQEFLIQYPDRCEDHTGMTRKFSQYMTLVTLAKAPFIRTACETGFNAGHSSLAWLMNPNIHVYAFDIGVHNYSHAMAKHLNKTFGGRLTVTWGDSRKTLPQFRRDHPDVRCDAFLIDGGHQKEVAQSDFDNFRAMASDNSVMMFEEHPFQGQVAATWENARRKGEIIEIFHCNNTRKSPRFGFSVGRFVRRE